MNFVEFCVAISFDQNLMQRFYKLIWVEKVSTEHVSERRMFQSQLSRERATLASKLCYFVSDLFMGNHSSRRSTSLTHLSIFLVTQTMEHQFNQPQSAHKETSELSIFLIFSKKKGFKKIKPESHWIKKFNLCSNECRSSVNWIQFFSFQKIWGCSIPSIMQFLGS